LKVAEAAAEASLESSGINEAKESLTKAEKVLAKAEKDLAASVKYSGIVKPSTTLTPSDGMLTFIYMSYVFIK
jgi:hypothetical protein